MATQAPPVPVTAATVVRRQVPRAVRRRLPQNDPDFVLHRSAVVRRAQPQQAFQLVIELADGEARHRILTLTGR